jgi:hypothetical protein
MVECPRGIAEEQVLNLLDSRPLRPEDMSTHEVMPARVEDVGDMFRIVLPDSATYLQRKEVTRATDAAFEFRETIIKRLCQTILKMQE